MTASQTSTPMHLEHRASIAEESMPLITGDGLNTYRIYCPNPLCKCLILREKHGRHVRQPAKFDMPSMPQTQAQSVPAPSVQADQGEADFFEIKDMMSFENIGFSKTVHQSVKFLSCADCDLGPLGYQEVGPDAYKGCFLHMDRVRYLVPSTARPPANE
ncbi:Mss4-like protein [Catenaria anguillulae PL171]|uniref:Mss4-like protein n=1 Tax=Catenaria anguillulae PL171 TaxID=765915 RepID=A0A1Y2HHR4_9FUNG|nr:Mss4-like protein [Catenaria anguillulae PL171]